jgi:hypothetical protein
MKLSRKLLSIIGRRNPAIYDAEFPHGPVVNVAALNPQPLPPEELGAALAAEFTRAAWFSTRMGLDAGKLFLDLDDWCPTGRIRIKLPPWWCPCPPPEPEPHPDWLAGLHLGFASSLAVMTESVSDDALAGVMNKAIDRSMGAVETFSAASSNVKLSQPGGGGGIGV